MSATIKIGKWVFAPETGVLKNGDDSQRLEHRAAALLEILARNPDQVVSHAEIVEKVWDGRSVSPNSVAVVISDIRRVLGDNSRQPTFIETLPKRGYRLIAGVTSDNAAEIAADAIALNKRDLRRPVLLFSALAAALVFVALLAGPRATRATSPSDFIIMVDDVINETGDVQYDPLTSSVTELLSVEIGRHDVFTISTENKSQLSVSGKLILWDGHPAMSIYAQSVSTGDIVWTGMASGPETLLPRQVREKISEFADLAGEADIDG